jgi:hypothetical protein
MTGPTESAQGALAILRDGSQFQWYVIPLFAVVAYVYTVEVEKRNWNVLFGGLAFWGMDWFNETWNSLIFHFTGYAPAWGAPGRTAYLVLIGLNIEISFMFAIAGVTFCKMLPANRQLKILGVPNRIFIAIASAAFCVFVEVLLNAVDALTWDWSWWNARAPWLIFLFGYLHFFHIAFWVHDMNKVASKVKVVGTIYAVDAAALLLFGPILNWI